MQASEGSLCHRHADMDKITQIPAPDKITPENYPENLEYPHESLSTLRRYRSRFERIAPYVCARDGAEVEVPFRDVHDGGECKRSPYSDAVAIYVIT
jgi:hypothetical protein